MFDVVCLEIFNSKLLRFLKTRKKQFCCKKNKKLKV